MYETEKKRVSKPAFGTPSGLGFRPTGLSAISDFTVKKLLGYYCNTEGIHQQAVEKLKTRALKRTYPGEVSFPRKRESRYVNGLLDARFHGHDEFDLLRVC